TTGLHAQFGVVSGISIGTNFVGAIVMIKGEDVAPFVLFVKLFVEHAKFEMGEGGIGISIKGALEGFDGPFDITGFGAFLAFDEAGIFLLIQIGPFRCVTAAEGCNEEQNWPKPKKHGLKPKPMA